MKKLNEIINIINEIDLNLLSNLLLYLKNKNYLRNKNDNEIDEILFYVKSLKIDIDTIILNNLEIIEEENFIMKDKKLISFRIDTNDFIKLKTLGKEKNLTISEILRKIIKEYLKKI